MGPRRQTNFRKWKAAKETQWHAVDNNQEHQTIKVHDKVAKKYKYKHKLGPLDFYV